MVVAVRLKRLAIGHPEANGNLRCRLRVRIIEDILPLVAERVAVRESEAENGLQPVFRLLTEARVAHKRVFLPARTLPMRLETICDIALLRLALRVNIVQIVPAGIPRGVHVGLHQKIFRRLFLRKYLTDHRRCFCRTPSDIPGFHGSGNAPRFCGFFRSESRVSAQSGHGKDKRKQHRMRPVSQTYSHFPSPHQSHKFIRNPAARKDTDRSFGKETAIRRPD